MPKYYEYKIYGYYLYFTSKCTLEAMHAHASDRSLRKRGRQNSSLRAMETLMCSIPVS